MSSGYGAAVEKETKLEIYSKDFSEVLLFDLS